MSTENITFEERLSQVEKLAEQLESGKLGLEDSMNVFEKGMKSLSTLEKELEQAQQRLTVIRQKADGTFAEVVETLSPET